MPVRLLVATTTWWPSVGVLASALEQAGFEVTLLCPRGHVGMRARRFATLEIDRHAPSRALAAALASVDPALVVAADDRAVVHLRGLHRLLPRFRTVIERSLGAPGSYPLLTARAALLDAAAAAGFSVPVTTPAQSEDDVIAWCDRQPPPWVLKADGAWGGEGVRIVDSRAAATRAFGELVRGPTIAMTLKQRFLNGDPLPWHERQAGLARAVSLQAYVTGRPATCALFAVAGDVRGLTIVEATATCGRQGPATVLRAIDRPDIVAHAARLARRLALSGFFGFDFLIDDTGIPHLLEMNPRITAASRLRTAGHDDPVSAAAAAFGCKPRSQPPAVRSVFAAFPLAWLEDPAAPALLRCREDLPWPEPDMLFEALRPLWPERGLLASLPAQRRRLRRWLAGDRRPDLRFEPLRWWRMQPSLRPPDLPGGEDATLAVAAADPVSAPVPSA